MGVTQIDSRVPSSQRGPGPSQENENRAEMFFFRIDARSDLDSQGRFSRGEVILVGINLSRH